MTDLMSALTDPHIPFLRYSLLAGILASFSFGVIGTYVVARRISYIAGAISHCVLGGIGLGLYLQSRFDCWWCDPIILATVTALGAAVVISLVSLRAKQREDTIIGAIWAFGMATGLLFIAKTPGYVDPMSYLFGNILLITSGDIWLIAGLDLLVVGLGIIFYSKFLAVSFDDEFALLRGINVEFCYTLLLCLTALTIVLLVRVVGIVLVIALLTLPPAVAGHFSRRLWQMMILSVLFCMVFTSTGLAVSYTLDLPSGPTIIVIAGLVYITIVILKGFLTRKN
ncbi:MAG: metal ABC transporter permease [Calditrichaeota bacterium]|nr:metal ABC transporter permease [Calditrichota bacterium]